jgi:hypothetical protein
MSVRVVARIRPLLKSEREVDVIVRTGSSATAESKSRQANFLSLLSLLSLLLLIDWRDLDSAVAEDPVRTITSKNEGEEYAFQFNGVYDAEVSQQELFDAEGEWLFGDALCVFCLFR